MNSNDERLLRYFENDMTPFEKKEFEAELQRDPELMKKLDAFRNVSLAFNDYKDITADERYFGSLIPRFNETKKKRKISVFAEYLFRPVYMYSVIGSLAAVIIIFITLSSVKKTLPESIQVVASQMQENELSEQLQSLKEDYYTAEKVQESIPDSIVHNYYYDEIKQAPEEVSQYITSTAGYTTTDNTIYNSITDDEADMIYSELINKKII